MPLAWAPIKDSWTVDQMRTKVLGQKEYKKIYNKNEITNKDKLKNEKNKGMNL